MPSGRRSDKTVIMFERTHLSGAQRAASLIAVLSEMVLSVCLDLVRAVFAGALPFGRQGQGAQPFAASLVSFRPRRKKSPVAA